MTRRELEIFVAVADCKNMSWAAKKLYIAPSSVSQTIAEIEKFYHVRLFDRISKTLVITDIGDLLLSYARHILALYQEMDHAMLSSAESNVKLRIGASPSIGALVMSRLISDFYREVNNVNTEVNVKNTNTLINLLLDNQLDTAMILGKAMSPNLISVPMFDDEMIFVCGKGHPFCERDTMSLTDLNGQSFILREEGCRTRALFDQEITQKGVMVKEQWNSNNTEAIKWAAVNNHGLTVLSSLLVEEELRNGTLHQIHIDNCCLRRTYYLVYHKNKYFFPAFQKFVAVCKSYCSEHLYAPTDS